ncbi:MAG: putative DNA modification/repair radical SAM protein [Agathobacter sp.]
MSGIITELDLQEKLKILADSAKFDVACTSSGVERKGDGKHMGNASGAGICHTFTSDGRCISLLKILFTNECIYDCRYCVNRSSNDVVRTSFIPEEVCTLTMEFYRRNYIEGLFLSSGIVHSPDYTMGLLYETLFLLRSKYHFNGYIHIKGIPGASQEVVEQIGYLCDRMSVNLEFPTAEGLKEIAPNKVRKNILKPMRQIQNGIKESREYHGVHSMQARVSVDEKSYYNQMAEIAESRDRMIEQREKNVKKLEEKKDILLPVQQRSTGLTHPSRYFVPAGQSTQMIVGATQETDYQIISVTEALYQKFDMKRVFYSAFVNVNQDETLPGFMEKPPLLREHRLYQADFLLRFYGFAAGELLSEKNPNFHEQIDPKCNWAVHHLEEFPVEINKADYYTLLRVPGIGTKSARRILLARKHAQLDFEDIKRMGVVLKRALYFITCKGRMMYQTKMEEDYITRHLIYNERPSAMLLSDGSKQTYEQMNLWELGCIQQA